jgi:uncharacterized delta-60 repeat protein
MKKQTKYKKLVISGVLMAAFLWMNAQPGSAQVGQCPVLQPACGPAAFWALTLAVQPDGKLIAAGYSNHGTLASPLYEFALVRYNADRSLDKTFGTGGKVTTAIGTFDDKVLTLAIQKDGKIVAAGHSHKGSQYELALVRYNKNGSLDKTFGTGGKVTTAIGSTYEEVALNLSIQPDGKLIVAGNSHTGVLYEFALARYNADGSLDSAFGPTGVATALATVRAR